MPRLAVALLATLALVILAAPLAAQAQPARKVPQVGVLWPDSGPSTRVEGFRQPCAS
jgi:hypothetical protein